MTTVYREMSPPILFLPLLSSLSAGKFKIGRILMSQNYFSLNTTVSGLIQNGAKLFTSVEGQNLHEQKITLYQYGNRGRVILRSTCPSFLELDFLSVVFDTDIS